MGANPVVLGLVGRARSGKDTIANHLVREHGFVRVAFADELKRITEELNPHVYDKRFLGQSVPLSVSLSVGGWEASKDSSSVRAFLQTLGESLRRRDPEFWIKVAEPHIERALHAGKSVVITDVRYTNEVEYVRHIVGSRTVGVVRKQTERPDSHISEQLDPLVQDHLIVNSGSEIEHLERVVDGFIENLVVPA